MSQKQGGGSSMYPWRMPQPFCSTLEIMYRMHPLVVYNSLTRSKVRFIPSDPKQILWYQCGPTVYAESHMGHARTYVSLDILRRIMKDVLGYNIIQCQNVTDIDDKIITRSSENGIPFRELACKYENEFLEDMASLGVLLPDMMTRVSEYVPEIISFIEDLVKSGIAYESNGSVYFSTSTFVSRGHTYGKLMPEHVGNAELLAEGEGALTSNEDKRGPNDFALWKRTKVHEDGIVEPSWESPWGNGRPGWHIECSAMSASAMEKFGAGHIDVHAGGIDLKFPHHENEIAQSEAYLGSNQWVNYWLHTGHVNIKGLKMSKSLKNFITIRQALEVYTPRQIRFCFLLHKYNDPMDYGDETMTQAVSIDRIFSEFFHNVKAVLRRLGTASPQHVAAKELTLLEILNESKRLVRESLLDDFDTPRAIEHLQELVSKTNVYLESESVSSLTCGDVARYVTSILRTFGLVQDNIDVGFPTSLDSGSQSTEALLTPYLDVLTRFRESVRIAAMSGDSAAVLRAADSLRDDILPDLGVRMEDKGAGAQVTTVWKLDDPETLRKEKAIREDLKRQKELQKAEAAKKQRERDEKAKIAPSDLFRGQTDLYSAFNAQGVPTHDAAGLPLSKQALKKLQKDWDKQNELHEKYIKQASA